LCVRCGLALSEGPCPRCLLASAGEPALPREFGKYSLAEELGRGGMGVIYRALDDAAGRQVALKMMRSEAMATESERAGFRREALAASQLPPHDHVIAIYEVGEIDDTPYFTMPLIEG